jgi:signal recognition particle GTPase
MLGNLGTNLKDALKKLAGKTVIDRVAVEELVKDLQRALLQADVNVKQVMQLSQTIKNGRLRKSHPKESLPASMSSRSFMKNWYVWLVGKSRSLLGNRPS